MVAMVEESGDGVVISLLVSPRARRERVVGVHGEMVKVQVSAPPEGGRANRSVVRLIARWLGVAEGQVSIISGHTGRRKRVRVEGVRAEEVWRRLRE